MIRMSTYAKRWCRVVVLSAIGLTVSCSDFPTYSALKSIDPPPGTTPVVAGKVAGDEVTIEVVASTAEGPTANANVTFVATGGGTVDPATMRTGSDGKARTKWTLGKTVGANTLTATAEGRTLQFTAQTKAGPPAALVRTTVPPTAVGTLVQTPPSVTIKDKNGNTIADAATVRFEVEAGDGVIVATGNARLKVQDVQASAGVASVVGWELGKKKERNSLKVVVGGVTDRFEVTPIAAAAASLKRVNGDGGSAIAGSGVTEKPSVEVYDTFGNLVDAGVDVTFVVTKGGGSVGGTTPAKTNAQGVATVSDWILGQTAGENKLEARVSGQAVAFTVLGVAGPAAKLVANAPLTQSAVASTPVPIPPSVKVTDQYDNLVTTARPVTFTAKSGSTLPASPATVNTVGGIATLTRWTLGPLQGQNTLVARSAGLTPDSVVFTARGTQLPDTVRFVAGAGQSATAGTPVAVPPKVKVVDAAGNPVEGVWVKFTATGPGTGATVAPDSLETNVEGEATVTGWSLGRTVGTNTLAASVKKDATTTRTATLTATGVPGTAVKLAANSSTSQAAAASSAVGSPPSVKVTDAYDNLVTTASPVTFTVRSGGGSTTPGSPATVNTTNGVATLTRWTLGPAQGANTLVARSTGLTPDSVLFTATATQLPDTVRFVAGAGQSATAGTPVAVPPKVKVVDAAGNPVEGVWVKFTATGPGTGATVAPDSLQTNAQGEATVTGWSLGRTVGVNTLAASVKKDATTTRTATLTATGVPGTAAKLVRNSTDPQSAAASSAVGSPPSVRVTDAYDNAVGAGTNVVFTVTAGGGTLSPASPATLSTNASGIATVSSWTLGPAQGGNTLVASSGTLLNSPMTFTATATQLPDTVRFIAGAGQSAAAGTPVAVLPKVKVVDAAGNPVAGWWVRFTATGPGTGVVVTPDSAQTNAQGEATVTGWSLGRTVGVNTLTATVQKVVGTLRTATLTATGVPGAAAKLVRNSTDPQMGQVSTAVGSPPSVRVTDAYDNAVGAGTNVVFTMTAGGGTLNPASPATVSTNASGIATLTSWTLGAAAGTNTVEATSGTLQFSPMTFTATATAQVPTTITVNAGNNLSATVGTAVATDPSVVVRDASNAVIANVSVTFRITGGGGTVNGGATFVDTTDVAGIATVPDWTLGTTAGVSTNTLTAEVTTDPSKITTFTATANAGPPATITRTSAAVDSGATLTAVAAPTVTVRDQYNNLVPSTNVTFTVATGAGTVNGGAAATVQTDGSGVATVSWVLGSALGSNTLTVTSGAAPAVGFTSYALLGYQNGWDTSTKPGTAGALMVPDLQVMVGDQTGAGVGTGVGTPGEVLVTFTRTQGGGTLVSAPPNVQTSATRYSGRSGTPGITTMVEWWLGPSAGANEVTASVTINGKVITLKFKANGS
ncbi:MAG: Ig-like domain-containing protein [Gemmatimonadetes bacterium]|nr:Ig-like domain-containing protein [Gemmatimonadota bacterium]